LLFAHFDVVLDDAAEKLVRELRRGADPARATRGVLDDVVQGLLGALDNVGCILPEREPLAYLLLAVPDEEGTEPVDVRIAYDDHADRWLEHLHAMGRGR
jgi:hypothetical protein